MKPRVYFFGIAILTFMMAPCAGAVDTLYQIMQRMQSDKAVRISYRETRTLELMDKPWHGSGYMYSLPPNLMIMEQLKPERLLMAVKGEQMFYFDPANDVRHQDEMSDDNPLSLNIGLFRALMNADLRMLFHLYQVDFKSSGHGWFMTLKPKRQGDSGFSVVISGSAQKPAEKITIRQPDGDFSEFSLKPDTTAHDVDATVNRLYRELLGE